MELQLEYKARLDPKAFKVFKDGRAQQVFKGAQVLKAPQVLKASRAYKA
jgi:hypothetical protein